MKWRTSTKCLGMSSKDVLVNSFFAFFGLRVRLLYV